MIEVWPANPVVWESGHMCCGTYVDSGWFRILMIDFCEHERLKKLNWELRWHSREMDAFTNEGFFRNYAHRTGSGSFSAPYTAAVKTVATEIQPQESAEIESVHIAFQTGAYFQSKKDRTCYFGRI